MNSPVTTERRRGTGSQASWFDVRMRRLLRVDDGARAASDAEAQSVFGKSIAVSAVRCTLTYVVLPLLAPVVDLAGGVGPALGLVIGTVSMVAIVMSLRRFWSAMHPWRWGYSVIGGGVFLLLVVAAVDDIVSLTG